MMKPQKEARRFEKKPRLLNLVSRRAMSPDSSDADDELGPILPASTSLEKRPSAASPVVSHNDDDDDDDDDEVPLSFKIASASVKNRPSAASPVVSHNDDDVPLSFKRKSASVKNMPSAVNPDISDRKGASVKNMPSAVNPDISDNEDDFFPLSSRGKSASVKNMPSAVNPDFFHNDDDYASPTSFKRAITFVKNKSWAANPVIFDNDDDEPPLRSSKRAASTSVKNRPTLSKRKTLERLDRQLLSTEDSEGDEKTQKIEDHAKSAKGDGGRPKKKHKDTTSVPSTEDNMLAFMGRKREQAGMEQKASQQGQQYSISRCLEVLHGMDDVSDEIKVLASDVLKDVASREFFLCYESRLRGLWLKKEVAKLGTQLPPW